MATNTKFLSPKGNYKNLIVYQKAECIYDTTYIFAHKFLDKSDRTIDQMVQAARSGKQNIVEGTAAAATSSEMELKLLNVARASLKELLADYEDYLRVRNLCMWSVADEKYTVARRLCREHNDSAYYREIVAVRTDETVANIAIILLHQTDTLLGKLIESRKEAFITNGGVREEMTRVRTAYRAKNEL